MMRDLYEARDLQEAQLLVDRLAERGIRTHIRNSQLHGALGELPLSVLPIVCITEPIRWPHAVSVLEEFKEASKAGPSANLRCGSCGELSPGNFELCWKCREPF
jgi:hypothetical protein